MSIENGHGRKVRRRLTVVLLSSSDTEKTRTISISRLGLVGSVIGLFFGIAAVVFVLIIYTPLHFLFPVFNSDLERKYGKEIAEVQSQVNRLVNDMNVLKEYNVRLRNALGTPSSGGEHTTQASSDTQKSEPNPQMYSSARSERNFSGGSGGDEETSDASLQNKIEYVQAGVVRRDEPTVSASSVVSLTTPVEGYLTRGFDIQQYHYGIDIANKVSSPVVAAADGNVVFSGWTYDDGYEMMIAHEGGYVTVYKHNQSLLKTTGSYVKRGEMIALLGSTGKTSSGPHLHFEVWKDGTAYDPAQYLLKVQ
jgi:murein DD-endopeptidase MepM/ murein hydrolase activator NlpD